MSPGFTSRPSLSVRRTREGQDRPRVSPGFTSRPSLSDGDGHPRRRRDRVSPGFTSRPSLSDCAPWLDGTQGHGVSPGFTSRPSLSAAGIGSWSVANGRRCRALCVGVAGIHVPAFVERTREHLPSTPFGVVSPGFTSRPSLSGLDVAGSSGARDCRRRVAGIHVPAFVERRRSSTTISAASWSVAGIHVPAFVERDERLRAAPGGRRVAGIHVPAFVERP